MPHRIAKGIVIVSGLLVLVAGLLIMARDASRVRNWSRSGFTLCSVRQTVQGSDTTLAFFGVVPSDFVSPPYPRGGDTVLTLNDTIATEHRWISLLEMPHTPGRIVAVTFKHKGISLETALCTRPVQPILQASVFLLQALKLLIFLSFLFVGLWAFYKRSDSRGVRVLALYCFAMATFTVTTYMPMYREMASFKIPFEQPLLFAMNLLGALFSSFWLFLNLVFPRPTPLMQKRPWLGYVLAFAPQAALMLSGSIIFLINHQGANSGRFVFYGFTVAQVIAGFLILRYNHFHAENLIERRQTKVVLWGSGAGVMVFLVYLLERFGIITALFTMPLVPRMLVTDLIFLILLLSPMTLAYAFGKFRLLEVEGRLKRGSRRIIALTLLAAVVVVIAYAGNRLISANFSSGNPITVVILSAVVIGIFRGAQGAKLILERRLYPERVRLREMISEFLRRTSTIADKQTFYDELESRLADGLSVDGVYPVLRCARNGGFLLRDTSATPFQVDSDLVRRLLTELRPLMVDEAICCGQIAVSEEESAWLGRNRVALILPMTARGELIGFLGFGNKTDDEDYEAEELRILHSFAPQVAIACDNIRLLEENIEKRRMEEELAVARRVQEGLLPQELPPTPGLELAANSTFCLEVAGDYYDVIALDANRTAVAIGDVAGKGTGAALIMASLQASLRALSGMNLPLYELMSRINLLIHKNTEPGYFITLFVGIFDASTRNLTYVNAGHNPPLLFHCGQVDSLYTGGLLLGPFVEAVYTEEIVPLCAGDVLLLYTDGVSEAMNEAEEELGEARLTERVAECVEDDASEILTEVKHMVAVHQGAALAHDDQTVLVAKVL